MVSPTLAEVNEGWKQDGKAFAQENDLGWTMLCPSCSITLGSGKFSLIEAMNHAITHRINHCPETAPAGG